MNTIVKDLIGRDLKTRALTEIDVDVAIDIRKLAAELGWKAYQNKSRKSRAIGGSIVVTLRAKRLVQS